MFSLRFDTDIHLRNLRRFGLPGSAVTRRSSFPHAKKTHHAAVVGHRHSWKSDPPPSKLVKLHPSISISGSERLEDTGKCANEHFFPSKVEVINLFSVPGWDFVITKFSSAMTELALAVSKPRS